MFAYLRDAKVSFFGIGANKNANQTDLQRIILDCSYIYGTTIKSIDFNQSLYALNNLGVYYMSVGSKVNNRRQCILVFAGIK